MNNVEVVGKTCSNSDVKDWLLHDYKKGIVVGFDTETQGINPRTQNPFKPQGEVVCFSLYTQGRAVFLWAKELEEYREWFANTKALKVGHNVFNFDLPMMKQMGYELNGIAGCTLDMSRFLYNSSLRNHGLKSLCKAWLDFEQPQFENLFSRPAGHEIFVQETKKLKGKVINLEYKETKRKVGEKKGVPTLLVTGNRCTVSFAPRSRQLIPLTDIPLHYPEKLNSLYRYAAADAYITHKLYYLFMEKMEKTECIIQK